MGEDRGRLLKLVLQMASRRKRETPAKPETPGELEKDFLSRFEEEQKSYALELLDLARASYRLRDDDNIYLERSRARCWPQWRKARRRIQGRSMRESKAVETDDLFKAVQSEAPAHKEDQKAQQPAKKRNRSPSSRGRFWVSLPDPEWLWEKRGSCSTPQTFSVFKRGRSSCATQWIPE